MSKISALANHLGVDESEIVERHNHRFEVNPHTRLVGTSPDEARRLVKQLFDSLELARQRVLTLDDSVSRVLPAYMREPLTGSIIRQVGYSTLKRELRVHAPETLEIARHEVLNTLYYLCPETDGEKYAVDYRDMLREAAQGIPIRDRRISELDHDGEYLVLTGEEAAKEFDESLDNYFDECVLPDLSETAQRYFDIDTWKRDARIDGRGHCLAPYDSNETEVYDKEDDRYYYIYQTD